MGLAEEEEPPLVRDVVLNMMDFVLKTMDYAHNIMCEADARGVAWRFHPRVF